MSLGRFHRKTTAATLAEINMVPMIDVMLVLLVIFIVTAPLITHSVNLELPKANSQLTQSSTTAIELSIQEGGNLFWGKESINEETLKLRLTAEGKKAVQAPLHIRADQESKYKQVAEILAYASQAGLSKIGFISLPESQTP